MRRLSESELLFLSVFMLSTLSLVPAALQVYDKHKFAALIILAAAGGLLIFTLALLWAGRPRLRVKPL